MVGRVVMVGSCHARRCFRFCRGRQLLRHLLWLYRAPVAGSKSVDVRTDESDINSDDTSIPATVAMSTRTAADPYPQSTHRRTVADGKGVNIHLGTHGINYCEHVKLRVRTS